MTKRRPPGVRPDMRAGQRAAGGACSRQSALEELRRQNQDLISALEDLRQQKDQLVLLNAELQETNRGVMALYSELSNELEQTNRGVVALYAELDETSERLRAASESKDRFWANVSHELRTPLNSIIGLTRLLAEPGAGRRASTRSGCTRSSSSGTRAAPCSPWSTTCSTWPRPSRDSCTSTRRTSTCPPCSAACAGWPARWPEGKPVTVTVSDDGDPDTPGTILTDEVASDQHPA